MLMAHGLACLSCIWGCNHSQPLAAYPYCLSYKTQTRYLVPFRSSIYLTLQHLRFALPLLSPTKRWALTPPFHPYLWDYRRRFVFCGTICHLAIWRSAFLLRSKLRCVVQTFLSEQSERQASLLL